MAPEAPNERRRRASESDAPMTRAVSEPAGGHRRFSATRTKLMECRDKPVSHDSLRQTAFFKDRDPKLLELLLDTITLQIFLPGHDIIKEGDTGETMYFLYRGEAEVLVGPQEMRVAELKDGSIFGEMALLGLGTRKATIRAISICDCRVIHADAFNACLKRFPAEKEYFMQLAKDRIAEINKAQADKNTKPPQKAQSSDKLKDSGDKDLGDQPRASCRTTSPSSTWSDNLTVSERSCNPADSRISTCEDLLTPLEFHKAVEPSSESNEVHDGTRQGNPASPRRSSWSGLDLSPRRASWARKIKLTLSLSPKASPAAKSSEATSNELDEADDATSRGSSSSPRRSSWSGVPRCPRTPRRKSWSRSLNITKAYGTLKFRASPKVASYEAPSRESNEVVDAEQRTPSSGGRPSWQGGTCSPDRDAPLGNSKVTKDCVSITCKASPELESSEAQSRELNEVHDSTGQPSPSSPRSSSWHDMTCSTELDSPSSRSTLTKDCGTLTCNASSAVERSEAINSESNDVHDVTGQQSPSSGVRSPAVGRSIAPCSESAKVHDATKFASTSSGLSLSSEADLLPKACDIADVTDLPPLPVHSFSEHEAERENLEPKEKDQQWSSMAKGGLPQISREVHSSIDQKACLQGCTTRQKSQPAEQDIPGIELAPGWQSVQKPTEDDTQSKLQAALLQGSHVTLSGDLHDDDRTATPASVVSLPVVPSSRTKPVDKSHSRPHERPKDGNAQCTPRLAQAQVAPIGMSLKDYAVAVEVINPASRCTSGLAESSKHSPQPAEVKAPKKNMPFDFPHQTPQEAMLVPTCAMPEYCKSAGEREQWATQPNNLRLPDLPIASKRSDSRKAAFHRRYVSVCSQRNSQQTRMKWEVTNARLAHPTDIQNVEGASNTSDSLEPSCRLQDVITFSYLYKGSHKQSSNRGRGKTEGAF